MLERHLPAVTPLTARSIAISTLLGYEPPELPVSALVKVGALFDIAERTTRVALTRMVGDGDVTAIDGTYRLTERLVQRQALQQDGLSPQMRPWEGSWELAVVTAPSRPLPERVALRKSMVGLRLAELREGVWVRPDNLLRSANTTVTEQCTFFEARYREPSVLAASLWDLPYWATEARRLRDAMAAADSLTDGFMISAEVIRHLLVDPCLPPELQPENWPGDQLREHYRAFNASYARRLREYSFT